MKRPAFSTPLLSLATTAIVFRLAHRTGLTGLRLRVSRRTLLKAGGLGLSALASGAWKSRSSVFAASSQVVSHAGTCLLAPKQTEGPYYIPKEKIRGNLVEHKPGTPLKLQLRVIDAATCKPIKNAAVDIWHCDAGGVYAGFQSASAGGPPGGGAGPTDKATFLRGIQMTNSQGYAEFQTVYPGWYRGRTVHIHVKVHLGGQVVGHVVHTGQLYFPDTLTAKVYQTGVYRSRAAARDTFNTSDGIDQSGGRQSTLALKRDGRGGYIGAIALGVHRS